jgi:hypothetical protein
MVPTEPRWSFAGVPKRVVLAVCRGFTALMLIALFLIPTHHFAIREIECSTVAVVHFTVVFLAVPFRTIPVRIAFRHLALELFGVLFAVLRVLVALLIALLVFVFRLTGVWEH